MNRAELIALAERVEAATGPDRDLDALIHCVREDLVFVMIATGDEAYGDICDPSDSGYGTRSKTQRGLLYARFPDHKNLPTLGGGKRGNIVQGCTPANYTASLDAAMTLVPEGWFLGMQENSHSPAGQRWSTWLEKPSDDSVERYGVTPALALCVAALRARASQVPA